MSYLMSVVDDLYITCSKIILFGNLWKIYLSQTTKIQISGYLTGNKHSITIS